MSDEEVGKFNIVSALSGHGSRRPSEAPASALWLYEPTIYTPSLEEREADLQILLEHFYAVCPPEMVARWRAEAAGKPPSEELMMFSEHLDDWFPEWMYPL